MLQCSPLNIHHINGLFHYASNLFHSLDYSLHQLYQVSGVGRDIATFVISVQEHVKTDHFSEFQGRGCLARAQVQGKSTGPVGYLGSLGCSLQDPITLANKTSIRASCCSNCWTCADGRLLDDEF